MATLSTTGASTSHLLSRGLQRPASTCSACVAEQARVVHSPIRGHGRDATRSSRQPQAPRSSHWLLECSAYVGTDLAASSTYPLCGAGRRSFARPPKLEAFAAKLLLASARSQPRVSRQVRCWPEATLSQEPVAVLRSLPAVIGRKGIQRLPSHTLSRRVCPLHQAAVWRT